MAAQTVEIKIFVNKVDDYCDSARKLCEGAERDFSVDESRFDEHSNKLRQYREEANARIGQVQEEQGTEEKMAPIEERLRTIQGIIDYQTRQYNNLKDGEPVYCSVYNGDKGVYENINGGDAFETKTVINRAVGKLLVEHRDVLNPQLNALMAQEPALSSKKLRDMLSGVAESCDRAMAELENRKVQHMPNHQGDHAGRQAEKLVEMQLMGYPPGAGT